MATPSSPADATATTGPGTVETLATPPVRLNFAAHVLALAAAGWSERTAYLDDAGAMTYADLADAVRRCATALRASGLRREERVFVLMHDSTDWPVVFLGALHAGIVPVAVNTLLAVDDYAYMLVHSRAQAVCVSGALEATLDDALARAAGHEVHTVIVSRPATAPRAGRRTFADWIAAVAPADAAADTGFDEAAFWLWSSGSTGKPKGTVHTHGNLWWTAETWSRHVLAPHGDDVFFSAAKLFFAYGLGNALTFPLSVGATTVLMAERPSPASVFRRFVDHRPTIFFGVPTLYAAMLAAPDRPPRQALRLRVCTSAGEPLPRDIGERTRDAFGCDVLDGIGSTEMLHIFLSNRPGQVRYGTTGTPVPGYEIALRGEDDGPVADGEIGDLWIRGPSAALAYFGDRARSDATFVGPWTRSGDKYVRDADGFHTYAGRSDDMLKVSGQYVSPFEVEAALVQHPAVLEAAVIGRTDPDGLTRTKAFVVLKQPEAASDRLADELKQFVKDRLAPHKYPRLMEFLPELPKTATGKIQRFRLREREAAAAAAQG
jgi:benzoate-CoA ligase